MKYRICLPQNGLFATCVFLWGRNLRVRLATPKSLRKFSLRQLTTTCRSVWPGIYSCFCRVLETRVKFVRTANLWQHHREPPTNWIDFWRTRITTGYSKKESPLASVKSRKNRSEGLGLSFLSIKVVCKTKNKVRTQECLLLDTDGNRKKMLLPKRLETKGEITRLFRLSRYKFSNFSLTITGSTARTTSVFESTEFFMYSL